MLLSAKDIAKIVNAPMAPLRALLVEVLEPFKEDIIKSIRSTRVSVKVEESAEAPPPEAKASQKSSSKPSKTEVVAVKVEPVVELRYKGGKEAIPQIVDASGITTLLVDSLKRHGRSKDKEWAQEACESTLKTIWGKLPARQQKLFFELATHKDFSEFAEIWQQWHDAISKKV